MLPVGHANKKVFPKIQIASKNFAAPLSEISMCVTVPPSCGGSMHEGAKEMKAWRRVLSNASGGGSLIG